MRIAFLFCVVSLLCRCLADPLRSGYSGWWKPAVDGARQLIGFPDYLPPGVNGSVPFFLEVFQNTENVTLADVAAQAAHYDPALAAHINQCELLKFNIVGAASFSYAWETTNWTGYGLHHVPTGRIWAPIAARGLWPGLPLHSLDAAHLATVRAFSDTSGAYEWPPHAHMPVLGHDTGSACSLDVMATATGPVDGEMHVDGSLLSFDCGYNATFATRATASSTPVGGEGRAVPLHSNTQRVRNIHWVLKLTPGVLMGLTTALTYRECRTGITPNSPLWAVAVLLLFSWLVLQIAAVGVVMPVLQTHDFVRPSLDLEEDSVYRMPRAEAVALVVSALLSFLSLSILTITSILTAFVSSSNPAQPSNPDSRLASFITVCRSRWIWGITFILGAVAVLFIDNWITDLSHVICFVLYLIALCIQVVYEIAFFGQTADHALFLAITATITFGILYISPVPNAVPPTNLPATGYTDRTAAIAVLSVGGSLTAVIMGIKFAGMFKNRLAYMYSRAKLHGSVPAEVFERLVETGDAHVDDDGNRIVICPICMDDINIDSGGTHAITPCNHILHFACLAEWMSSHPVCPVCRADLNPLS